MGENAELEIAEIDHSVEVNHKEVADRVRTNAKDLGMKLFIALLVGSGVAILAILSVIASNDTAGAMKSLLVWSIWWFALCLVVTFLSGLLLSIRLEHEAMMYNALANKQSYETELNKSFKAVKYFSQFSSSSRAVVAEQRYLILKFSNEAESSARIATKANKIVVWLQTLALLLFSLGLFVPLFSVTLYDYF